MNLRIDGYLEALADADVAPAKRIALVVALLRRIYGGSDSIDLTCTAKKLLAYPPCITFPAASDPQVTGVPHDRILRRPVANEPY